MPGERVRVDGGGVAMKGAILETRCSAWVDQTPTEEMTKQLELAPGQKLPRRSCGAVVYVWLERPVRCSACGASYEFDAIGRLRPVQERRRE